MAKYDCSGCTALNDAICIAIDTVGHAFADMEEAERPEHVLCVIITDGMENASHEYTAKAVNDRIEHQKNKYGWQFEFLAADQDAFATGESLGIDHDGCMNFTHDLAGVNMLCSRMNLCMDKIRNHKKK